MTAVAHDIRYATVDTLSGDSTRVRKPSPTVNVEMRVLFMDKSTGQQSVTFEQLLEVALSRDGQRDTHKLRLRIKSDAYRAQSHARIERWDGAEWKEVAHLAPGIMATKEGLIYGIRGEIPDAWFEQDRAALLDRAVCTLLW